MICNFDCFNCQYDDCINDCTERQKSLYLYNHSDKGKARAERYNKSDKGKARYKRKQQKDIASGENAERCRRYYYKKKAEKELV